MIQPKSASWQTKCLLCGNLNWILLNICKALFQSSLKSMLCRHWGIFAWHLLKVELLTTTKLVHEKWLIGYHLYHFQWCLTSVLILTKLPLSYKSNRMKWLLSHHAHISDVVIMPINVKIATLLSSPSFVLATDESSNKVINLIELQEDSRTAIMN